jgi:hypothetical protein
VNLFTGEKNAYTFESHQAALSSNLLPLMIDSIKELTTNANHLYFCLPSDLELEPYSQLAMNRKIQFVFYPQYLESQHRLVAEYNQVFEHFKAPIIPFVHLRQYLKKEHKQAYTSNYPLGNLFRLFA